MIKKIKKNNKLIKSLILTQPIKEFKNYINKIKSNEKVIIVGSNDHTNAFVKIFENELKKNKNNFDYYEINQNDIYKKKKKINFFKNQKKPYFSKYDKIIISSFQHSEHIKESLIEQKISNFFSPYNNSSRSILDIFFINKYKTKYKLHSKKIF